MAESTLTFRNDGGVEVYVRRWVPASPCRAIVVIVHGLAEHSARYERFAEALAARGYAVFAPDLRGHGRTAGGDEHLGWAGPDGWNGMLRDLATVVELARAQYPATGIVLFGHSMGSFLAQRFAQLHGPELAGLILSGTSGSAPGIDAGIVASRVLSVGGNARKPSPLAKQIFAGFNKPFAPGRTGFEWLSRDEAEVQKYVDDPWCGFPVSNRFFTDMLAGEREGWKRENERELPTDLPVLLFAGDRDPVGRNGAGVTELTERYRHVGMRDVSEMLYPQGRHEMLNETNREQVVADVLGWLDEHTDQSTKMSSASGPPGETA
ncbi:MAG TPA: alpha/beta hydrolase [Candidatus Sulfotelmatobacter sp.]|nr:alpha/beta hydrolase [Candidatus Sulfotelmatobacter sp.]